MKKQINPTIKAYLIRGAFYLLLLIAVCAIPFALAQSRSRGTTKRGVATPAKLAAAPPASGVVEGTRLSGVHSKAASQSNVGSRLLPYDVRGVPAWRSSNKAASGPTGGAAVKNLRKPVYPQVVLYDQYDNDLDNGIVSADRTDDPSLSAEAADNFVVPSGQTWTVTEVDIRSPVGFASPTSFAVTFYLDDGSGLPGTQVYTASGLAVTGNPDYVITLTTPAVLTEGTYWVSAVGTITLGNWYWEGRSITNNTFATAWRNPLGGYGLGCTDWARLQDCLGFSWPDQMFRIVGTTVGGTPTPTPTASPTCTPGTFQVLIVYSDQGVQPVTLHDQIAAEPGVTTADYFDAQFTTPTLAQLLPYNIVVAFSNSTYFDPTGMGNVLADYADAGGIVVAFDFDWFGPPFGLEGRWQTGGYSPVVEGGPTHFHHR